jgi:L-alanine-DL-glutamate epimerase-like enolase superfamily enzyme
VVKTLQTFVPLLLGESPFNIEKIQRLMNITIPGNQCAKSAVDIATYDLMGKLLNVPVYQLIGGITRDKLPVLFALNEEEDSRKIAREAESRIKQGFRGIMVKIGRGIEKDAEMVRQVRESIGDNIPMIADPNQAYSTSEAIDLTKRIYKYIQALEGPIAGNNILGLRELKVLNLVPIIADESLFCPEDAINLIKTDAVDMFLIKLLKVGGFYKAKHILGIAQAAMIKCYAASMTSLGIVHAANLHFATASTLEDRYGFGFENLFQIFGSEEEIRERDITDTPAFKDGYYGIPPGPGLGVSLIEKNMAKYTLDQMVYTPSKTPF